VLLIVFGAGASYDSAAARAAKDERFERIDDRPPLANQLFDDRPEFVNDLDLFPQCKGIVQELRRSQT
jgi:hypothetical protein